MITELDIRRLEKLTLNLFSNSTVAWTLNLNILYTALCRRPWSDPQFYFLSTMKGCEEKI